MSFGGFGKPGQGAAVFTTEREIIPVGFENQLLYKSAVISGATRDAGNSPTTVLRPGLLLGRLTSGSEYEEWDADAADGTQYIGGILWKEARAQDFDATNTDRVFSIIVRAPLKADRLLIQGSAFVGHADEFLARRMLVDAGFWLDDDPMGYLAGHGYRMETVTGTADTLVAAQNGMTLFYSNAAAVLVTLPALAPGLVFDIVRTGDEEIVVASAEGDNMIVGNETEADSITFTTAGQHVGARVRLSSVYVGTALKWLVELPSAPFGTGLTGGFAYSIAS